MYFFHVHPAPQPDRGDILAHYKVFSLGLGRGKVLVLMFGPKMNTKVAFDHPPITINFLTSSSHSRRLKLGIQLNQAKPKPNLKGKYLKINLSKKSWKKVLKDYNFQAEHYSI